MEIQCTRCDDVFEMLPQTGQDETRCPRCRQVLRLLTARHVRQVSAMGIVSLVLGLIAIPFCVLPWTHVIAVCLLICGVATGIVSLVVATTRKETGIGVPTAGLTVSLVLLIMVLIFNIAYRAAMSG